MTGIRHLAQGLPRVRTLLAIALVGLSLAACETGSKPVATLNAPIEGRWALPGGDNHIRIAPCGQVIADGFCGVFLPSDPSARDHMNSDLLEWGRPLHGVQVIDALVPTKTPGHYHGTYYLPDQGETLFLDIRQTSRNRLKVLIYHGTNGDEIADVAINSLFSPLDALDAGWLAIRAAVGKEMLGTEQSWVRDNAH